MRSAPTHSGLAATDDYESLSEETIELLLSTRAELQRHREIEGLGRPVAKAVEALLGSVAVTLTPAGSANVETLHPNRGRTRIEVPCSAGGTERGTLQIELDGETPDLSAEQRLALALIGVGVGERLEQLATTQRLSEVLERKRADTVTHRRDLFRKQALARIAESRRLAARPLRVGSAAEVPGLGRTGLLLLPLALAALFLVFGRIGDHAIGRAVVVMNDRVDISRPYDGQVRSVFVRSGDRVEQGATLLELDSSLEVAELARLSGQFEGLLVRYLRDPSDLEVKTLLTQLRIDRQAAEARVRDRRVLAPRDGRVAEVRVLPGQHTSAGDLLVALVGGESTPELLGFLPVGSAPKLQPGQRARLRLDGFAGAFVDVALDSVSAGAVPATEVARKLGADGSGEGAFVGPAVSVRARLPSSFEDEGREYSIAHGQVGSLYVSTRDQRIIMALLPWLKEFLR